MATTTKKVVGGTGGSNAARIRLKKRTLNLKAPKEPEAKPQASGGIKKRGSLVVDAPMSRLIPVRAGIVPVTGELADAINLFNGKNVNVIRPLSQARLAYGRNSTGILTLDICLVGGFMNSRIAMIYGERSAGKSTVSTRSIGASLRANPDKYAVVVDVEGTVDKTWMRSNGVDTDRVIIAEPPTGEDAVDQLDALVRTKEVCAVALDSIAMITPMKEIESSAEDQQMGIQARLVGKMLRRVNNGIISERSREHYPMVILLNQIRMKIGMVFGDPRTLPGGKALEFVTSQQVEIKNKEHRDDKTGIVKFNEHTAIVTKDKTGGRYKEAKFKLIRDDEAMELPVGYIDQTKDIIDHGIKLGFVEGRYRLDGIPHKFAKASEITEYLVENPHKEVEICNKIVNAYRERWGIDA